MANKINYQKELEKIIRKNEETHTVPTLLLHSCCAPCSSYCLEYLSQYFEITDLYYNPNIPERDEYVKREEELDRLIREQPHLHEVKFVRGRYEPEKFFPTARRAGSGASDALRFDLAKLPELRRREDLTSSRRPLRSARSRMPKS